MSFLLAILAGVRELLRLLGGLRDDAATARAQDDGAARAEAETLEVIAEDANAQAEINAAHRDARSVGERLLQSADAAGRADRP